MNFYIPIKKNIKVQEYKPTEDEKYKAYDEQQSYFEKILRINNEKKKWFSYCIRNSDIYFYRNFSKILYRERIIKIW